MVLSIPRISALPVALLLPSVGLLLAYLYVLSQRPDIPDYLTVQDRESRFRLSQPYDLTAQLQHMVSRGGTVIQSRLMMLLGPTTASVGGARRRRIFCSL